MRGHFPHSHKWPFKRAVEGGIEEWSESPGCAASEHINSRTPTRSRVNFEELKRNPAGLEPKNPKEIPHNLWARHHLCKTKHVVKTGSSMQHFVTSSVWKCKAVFLLWGCYVSIYQENSTVISNNFHVWLKQDVTLIVFKGIEGAKTFYNWYNL